MDHDDIGNEIIGIIDDHDESTSSGGSSNFSSSSSSRSNNSLLNSSSDSDGNEIMQDDYLFPLLQILLHGRRRTKVVGYLNTINRKTDDEFREEFRLSRALTYNLINSLSQSGFIPQVGAAGKPPVSAELSFLMFLCYVVNEDPHWKLVNLFDISMSSVFGVIRRVSDWLITLVPEIIKWPSEASLTEISNGFEAIQGIPKCIGAIDGSHIYISINLS